MAGAAIVLAVGTAAPASAAFGILHSFGSFGASDGQLKGPTDVAVDAAGNIYVAEFGNQRVQKFSSAGAFLGSWPTLDKLDLPEAITVAEGRVYVVDSINRVVQRYSSTGSFLGTFGTTGSQPGQIGNPSGLAASADVLYLADSANHKILVFSAAAGQARREWGGLGSADGQFRDPSDVAVDAAGNVFVADSGNHRIQKFSSSGVFLRKWGSQGPGDGQFDKSTEIAVDGAGTVYVSELYHDRVQMFSSDGVFLGKFGGSNSIDPCEGQFSFPQGIATDAAGRVYVADSGNDRIQVFGEGGAPIPRCTKTAPGGTPQPGRTPPPLVGPPPVRPSAAPVVPAITGLSLSRRAFCVGRACPRARRGTLIRFSLAAPARIEFVLERRLTGRRADGRCRRATRRNRGGRRCDYHSDAGKFDRAATAGINSVAISGRVAGRALRAGRYRLSLTAIGATGARSTTQRIRFRVSAPTAQEA